MPTPSVPAPDNFDHAGPSAAIDPRRRLDFLDMGPADAERLRGMLGSFRRWADEFVEDFYRHLLSFDETARFLQSPGTVAWLKQVQRDHFESMLEARWDDDYFTRRQKVGLVHAEIGLEPQYFLGAYNQYVQYSFERLSEEHPADGDAFKGRAQSLLKAVLFDIGLTLDAYFAHSTRNLRQALDMYWRANAELRRFAQLTSHDLKTPLATVANLCDEALDEFGEQMPAAARELVAAAKDRTFRMSRMIDELLASAVVLRDEGAEATVSVQEAWDEAVGSLLARLSEREIEIAVEGRLPRVRGKKVLLREVFSNLLSNAVKFIDRRPGRVVLRSHLQEGTCELVIADNGPGVPTEEVDDVFLPFRRLSMHKDRPGSGLGLYFARNLVMEQGGRIWLTSDPPHGSEVHIELRLAEPAKSA
ncbi:MAG TPA: protoglobin domain-containing protein [Pirellulales bacterium]|nr:protoglobin domain-containing protein [Pirellulales bacterium]